MDWLILQVRLTPFSKNHIGSRAVDSIFATDLSSNDILESTLLVDGKYYVKWVIFSFLFS
jgi:hypothetical protein